MLPYSIVWAPEGRKIAEIIADNATEARREFKRTAKRLGLARYAKYMGEVYAQSCVDRLRELVGVTFAETTDGRWMILVDGVQFGGNRDASGAGDATWPKQSDAIAYARTKWKV